MDTSVQTSVRVAAGPDLRPVKPRPGTRPPPATTRTPGSSRFRVIIIGSPGLPGRLGAWLRAFRIARERHRTLARLAGFDDRLRNDLGLAPPPPQPLLSSLAATHPMVALLCLSATRPGARDPGPSDR